jgi:hypothetical protein
MNRNHARRRQAQAAKLPQASPPAAPSIARTSHATAPSSAETIPTAPSSDVINTIAAETNRPAETSNVEGVMVQVDNTNTQIKQEMEKGSASGTPTGDMAKKRKREPKPKVINVCSR